VPVCVKLYGPILIVNLKTWPFTLPDPVPSAATSSAWSSGNRKAKATCDPYGAGALPADTKSTGRSFQVMAQSAVDKITREKWNDHEDKTMAERISKLPRGKNKLPIDVVSMRLRNHLDRVLASSNETLIRMIEQFFSEIINRTIQERPKAEVVPIKREALKNDE
jgi:hypothetical protein